MDIDLLSKMVKELILDNDEVSLPGVGSFVAELVPSSFSDKGYTINPPYKRLSFRKKADASDNALIDFYAKSNNVDKETASKIVIDFLSEMQKVLELRKSIVFPGLGKLRATKENIFFFVADEDLDIYPEGFGLEPISLKTHEETPAEVSATIAALQDILNPEETEGQSDSEEPSEAVSGPEDASEVTGGGQPESSLEAEIESDNELQPEQQATAEESDHQSENESQHDEESEQETVQHVDASSSEDAPEVTDGGQPESSLEAESKSDNDLHPEQQATAEASELQSEQQATAEESDHQSENESQHEEKNEQETAQSSEGGTEEANEDQSGEVSSSEDVSETTGDEHPESESSHEAEGESDNAQKPEQQTTAEESDRQSENESQSEAESEQENEPQQEPESESDRVEETTEPVTPIQPETEPEQPRTEPAKKSRKGWKALIWTAVAIAALAVTFIVGFVILAHIAPDFIDSILYTQEELEIINH